MIGAGTLGKGALGTPGILTVAFMVFACGLEQRLGETGQDGVAGEAKDEIGMRVIEGELHQFRVGEVAITAQDDAGIGPSLPQAAQHPLEDHGVLRSGGTLAGTQGGGDEFAGESLEDKQRQVAVVAVMVVIKGEFLLAMGGILGVVHIEDNHRGWLGITGDELINKGLGHAVDIPGRGGIFQTREGGRTGQVTPRIQGLAIYPQLEERIGTQGVGVVAILVTAGDLVDALGQEIPQGMLRVGGMALIVEGLCQAVGKADLPVDAPQQQGAEIRGQGATLEVGTESEPVDRRKTQLFWDKLGHWRPRLASSEALLA